MGKKEFATGLWEGIEKFERFGVMVWVIALAVIVFFSFDRELRSVILGVALLGGIIALVNFLRRGEPFATGVGRSTADIERGSRKALIFGPNIQILRPGILGHPIGLIIAVGLGLVLLFGVPQALPFILGTLTAGVILAIVFWWERQ